MKASQCAEWGRGTSLFVANPVNQTLLSIRLSCENIWQLNILVILSNTPLKICQLSPEPSQNLVVHSVQLGVTFSFAECLSVKQTLWVSRDCLHWVYKWDLYAWKGRGPWGAARGRGTQRWSLSNINLQNMYALWHTVIILSSGCKCTIIHSHASTTASKQVVHLQCRPIMLYTTVPI